MVVFFVLCVFVYLPHCNTMQNTFLYMKRTLFAILALVATTATSAQSVREKILIDAKWQFALGDASSPAADFGCGTEYFNYLTKANSIHNEGPYSPKFDAQKWSKEWREVDLPHDWVVDLPFAGEASHSHGYKTVGYKYPQTSVGWYRKTFKISPEDYGKRIYLQFDGIFRDARVWVNGFYLGGELSGYATQIYDISEYLNYSDDADNLVCVRADATLEEGWFYEGAGIYRHVWLCKSAAVSVAPFGTSVSCQLDDLTKAEITIATNVENVSLAAANFSLRHKLIDADGKEVAAVDAEGKSLKAKELGTAEAQITLNNPHLWSCDDPYLYKVVTEVYSADKLVDSYTTTTGFRKIEFTSDRGFLLNDKPLKIKGVNMHQDHAGVGAGMPDALQVYRLKRLKDFGCNAYRASHNPMTPETLDACDSLGILVIEENRLTGINDYHLSQLRRMIERDRNHPSIILWSVGNEEWGIEWNEFGERVAASMREYVHLLDPTRPMTVATSGGPVIVKPADVAGYNYIMQNPVDQHHTDYPERCAYGSEETSGCGTRGVYFDSEGLMVAHNRRPNDRDSLLNCIERGWKFYHERPWLAGLFYWTGFDYRGEPNPLTFPATGSEFGLLDYCGFPKDEAYYLKSWWTDEVVLHLLPHWNLEGHEGETIDVWAYSNCDEVELFCNGKSLGRQTMPKDGHLEWKATYKAGAIKAVGYKNGKRVKTETLETTGTATRVVAKADRANIAADGRDVAVVNLELRDKKQRFVPTACNSLTISVEGPARIIGVGNGASNFQSKERSTERVCQRFNVAAFNGLAQVLVQSVGEVGTATITVEGEGLTPEKITISLR